MAYMRGREDKEAILREVLKKDGCPGGVWLLCGQEDYLSRYYLTLLRKKVIPDPDAGYFDHIRLSGGSGQEADAPSLALRIQDACAGLPVMNEGKLVEIAEPAFSDMTPTEFKEFCTVLGGVRDYPYVTVVILCAEEEFPTDYRAVTGAEWKALEAAGVQIVPFERQPEQKLVSWCRKHFQSEGVFADDRVILAMIRRCGASMSALSGEMKKLSEYEKASGRTEVTEEDMLFVTSPSEEAREFGISNAVRERDITALLRECAVQKHLHEDPMTVFFGISAAVTELLRVSCAVSEGCSQEDMMRMFRMKEYPLKLAVKASKNYTNAELSAIMKKCAETDLALKSTPVDGYVLVERLICALAVGGCVDE